MTHVCAVGDGTLLASISIDEQRQSGGAMARAIFQTVSSMQRKGEIVDAMKVLRDRTRNCLGCVESSIEQDIEDSRKIRLTVIFDSPEHLKKFLQSDVLVSIFQLVELSIEQPDIFFSWENEKDLLYTILEMRKPLHHPRNHPVAGALPTVALQREGGIVPVMNADRNEHR
jgi:quinol monooxygenase YgiN